MSHSSRCIEIIAKLSPLFRNVNSQETKDGEQRLSAQTRRSPLAIPKSQGFREMCRDVLGCLFVILVSILVYFTDSEVAKYIDPVFAIISSITLFVLCYPYSKYRLAGNSGIRHSGECSCDTTVSVAQWKIQAWFCCKRFRTTSTSTVWSGNC